MAPTISSRSPFPPEYLVEVVRRALEKRRLVLEVRDLRRQLEQRDLLEGKLIGRAPGMQNCAQCWSASPAAQPMC
jgi:DNA-binding NtrC family response regulator